MANQFHVPKGSGFYAALALGLVAVGICGYALLPDRDTPKETSLPSSQVSSPSTKLPDVRSAPAPVHSPRPAPAPSEPPVKEEQPVSAPAEVPAASEASAEPEEPMLVVSPLQGEVVTAFSMDELLYNETLADWRTHDGIDIATTQGTAVNAACAGTVVTVGDDPLMGTTVVVKHPDGYQTTYANLQSKPPVKEGMEVTAGQVIGAVGHTAVAEADQGPHLHFSVCTEDGTPVNPDDFLAR